MLGETIYKSSVPVLAGMKNISAVDQCLQHNNKSRDKYSGGVFIRSQMYKKERTAGCIIRSMLKTKRNHNQRPKQSIDRPS